MIRLLPMVGALATLFVFADAPTSFSRGQEQDYFQAPPGYASFCKENSKLCAEGRTTILPYTMELEKTLTEVNDRINQLPYVFDTSRYHSKDYWDIIDANGGDCEDYAAKKKLELIELGLPADALKFIFLYMEKEGNLHTHVVLAVKTDKGDLILDNYSRKLGFKEEFKDYTWLLEEDTVDLWKVIQN